MAEIFLFNIAEKVVWKLGSVALQEVSMAWGVHSELKKLENTISTIQAVLLDAEEQQANNHQLTDWLGKIKDALYDADDVLDEFQYEALRSQVVNRGGIKRKVCNVFSRSNSLTFHCNMGRKIKEIREKLDGIAAEKAKFHLSECDVDRCHVMHEERMTHSFVRASDVIGRDDDRENIVKLLMCPGDGKNISIIPIVGIGGLGKTTVAKMVYNDERVTRHFDLKMWVSVLEDFNAKKLTKNIINSVSGECLRDNLRDDLTIDQLQTCLQSILDNKKFLLILDDVWNDDRGKWIELRDLLVGCANGSKIIVTTRSQLVAFVMGTIPAYNLKGLSHGECLSLFAKWAFREGEEKWYPNLLKIGDEIVKKCGGIPLAVRTLGSLLFSKMDVSYWMHVKNNDIWKLEQKENDILPALKLSYNQMPSYLKQCFAFCSIFPKGFEFYKNNLIELWIAQGLLQLSNENQELEDIGEQYVNKLRLLSFFQDVKVNGPFPRFKMHDLVHDLALLVAPTECYSHNISRRDNISKSVRHVSFSGNDLSLDEVPRLLLEQNNLRTILFPIRREVTASKFFVETCISKFKSLRVLDLRSSSLEVLPSSIGKLKHLRYLDLSWNTIKKLPNSICKLQHLQTLKVEGCWELEELPINIGNLINLRVLILTSKQMLLPEEGIGRLSSLRLLAIAKCVNLKYLGEGMQHLTALRTLAIWYCRSLESLSRNMKYLSSLETLSIENCGKFNSMEGEDDGIQAHKLSLQRLWISGLPQLMALPKWLQGAENTLQLLHIESCRNLKALPEWLQNLTSLQKLEIIDCPELSTLPEGMHRLTALRELTVEWCSPILSSRCNQETGEDWSKISHVRDITVEGKRITSIDGQVLGTSTRDEAGPSGTAGVP